MAPTVEPGELLKEKIECPCGCGKVGLPRVKTWKGESGPHVRQCKCAKSCARSTRKKRANRRERGIAQELGGRRQVLSGAANSAGDFQAPLRTGKIYGEATWDHHIIGVPRNRGPEKPDKPTVWIDEGEMVHLHWDDFKRMTAAAQDRPRALTDMIGIPVSDHLSKWWQGQGVQDKYAEVGGKAAEMGGVGALVLQWDGQKGDLPVMVVMNWDSWLHMLDDSKVEVHS